MNTDNNTFEKAKNELEKIYRKKVILNRSYWQKLLPDFPITDRPFDSEPVSYQITSTTMDKCIEQLKHDGYFVTPPIIPESDVEQLKQIITKLVNHNHAASYALVYDVFYKIISRLGKILTPILGPDYQFVPDEFSCYYIKNDDNSKGAKLHRDSIYSHGKVSTINDLPTLINIWIPITDVETDNSCISVLPLHADPYFRDGIPMNLSQKTFSLSEVSNLLQKARALPAPAGSVLGWNSNLMHWGTNSSQFAGHPRLSVAAYFQSARVPAYHPFTMKIPATLPFDYRIYLIEKVVRDKKIENNTFKDYQTLWQGQNR